MCAGKHPSAGRSQPGHTQHTAHMWMASYTGREIQTQAAQPHLVHTTATTVLLLFTGPHLASGLPHVQPQWPTLHTTHYTSSPRLGAVPPHHYSSLPRLNLFFSFFFLSLSLLSAVLCHPPRHTPIPFHCPLSFWVSEGWGQLAGKRGELWGGLSLRPCTLTLH